MLSLLHYIDTVMEFLPKWNSGQCCWPVKAITGSVFLITHITLLANTVKASLDELSMPFQKTSETGDLTYSLGVETGI